MNDCGILHLIETDLSSTWIDELARDGVCELEDYLAKYLAFLTFLDEASP